MLSVAVIGGGAAGLAAVSYLLREKDIHVTLFEERSGFGGVWTNQSTSTQPNPMYDGLETNVPHTLMTFTGHHWPRNTPVFPPHDQVLSYLRTYTARIRDPTRSTVHLSTKVVELRLASDNTWAITTESLFGRVELSFNAVVIAAGNYSDPHITPDEPGRNVWADRGNHIMHSSEFKNANAFTNKRVLIVGNGPSGWDISERVARVAAEVVVSVRSLPMTVAPGVNRAVGLIKKYEWRTRTVTFYEGKEMSDIDVVIYCTGYRFNFPFAIKYDTDRNAQPLFPPGFRVRDLFQHMFYISQPSLALVGLPKMTAAFTVAEAQSAVIARVFSGRITLPAKQAMESWNRSFIAEHRSAMISDSNFHSLPTRTDKDKDYVNFLERVCATASDRFLGKPPPYWCNCLDSAKASVGAIRAVFKAQGGNSAFSTTYHQLGALLVTPCTSENLQACPTGATCCFLDPATR
ncbi:uncharacterized protein RCC_01980 [Ramularia collo-cygni]|uniref:Flavin-containing monooxygenase n=1 Tax=Ramularia collo-cygni TaxID=112498 RepID=A0A2D3V3R0_9PEZI|nr:uncharacterized protein RCC_01980 [Ramularia collo-cygni]CZT16139.1 uncharacterized protein RCC_01980 [Ramularia collo-cygni]